jgi:hypothetical protein
MLRLINMQVIKVNSMNKVSSSLGVSLVLLAGFAMPAIAQDLKVPRSFDEFTSNKAIRDSTISGGGVPTSSTTVMESTKAVKADPEPTAADKSMYVTCNFKVKESGVGTSSAAKLKDGSCQQGGTISTTKTVTVSTVFRVGDSYVGTSGASGFGVQLSDENAYTYLWSGDCSGTESTCTSNEKSANWKGDGPRWDASVKIIEKSTAKEWNKSVYSIYSPCGSGRYQCP